MQVADGKRMAQGERLIFERGRRKCSEEAGILAERSGETDGSEGEKDEYKDGRQTCYLFIYKYKSKQWD